MVTTFQTDWGVARVPEKIAELLRHSQPDRFGFYEPDRASFVGRALVLWQERQIQRCNESQMVVPFEDDLTPYLEAAKAS